MLQDREPRKLLGKQVTDGAKDHRLLLQEGSDLAPEEFGDGLGDDFQGQRVAHIQLDEAQPVVRGANDVPFLEELLAGLLLQPSQAQGAHGSLAALQ